MSSSSTALTMRQQKVVEVLVSGKAETVTEAAALAGVHRNSVHAALRNSAVQREKQLQLARKSDKARDIYQASSSELAGRLAGGEMQDMSVVAAFNASADVVAQGIEEEDSSAAGPHEVAAAYQRRLRDFQAGIRYCLRQQRQHK